MGLPSVARIDRVVAKKQFYKSGNLSSADRKLFDHVEKIYWWYALKTENTFIPTFADEEWDYPEIEVMEVVLREVKQINRLAEVTMRSIPYPMLIFFQKGERYSMKKESQFNRKMELNTTLQKLKQEQAVIIKNGE